MKDFLKTVLGTTLGGVLLLVLLAIFFSAAFAPEEIEVESGSILTLDLGLSIQDRSALPSLQEAVMQGEVPSLALHEVLETLKAAARDENIAALHLSGVAGARGASTSRALHQGILDFRHSGKPVIAYAPKYDDATYYLASAADSLHIAPIGEVMLDGFAAEVMYYTSFLNTIGVEMQVTRVGKYKSAVEPFMLEEMSPANREQMANFLGDLADVMRADIARARGWTDAEMSALLAEGGLFTGEVAVASGLVTSLKHRDEIQNELWSLTGEEGEGDDFPQISLRDYLTHHYSDEDKLNHPYVAVVFAEGEIVDGESSGQVGGDTVARLIREARLDEDAAAIVLRVNSPGGSASASEVILREIELAKEAKPVVVSMGDLAASGGYWISCKADYILAEPNTLTGSIGVFGMFPNVEGLLQKLGINIQTVRTGPYADMMSFYRPKTEDELAKVQAWVDSIYDGFLDRVSEGRSLSRDAVHEIAQGRVWSGKDALDLGLVDALGDLDDALNIAASRADLEADYGVNYLQPEADPFEQFLAEALQGKAFLPKWAHLPSWWRMASLEGLLKMHGPQARLPFFVEVR